MAKWTASNPNILSINTQKSLNWNVTEPFGGVHPDLPILRDPDGYTYFKEEVGGLVVGGFEPEAKPWVAPEKRPSVSSATRWPSFKYFNADVI